MDKLKVSRIKFRDKLHDAVNEQLDKYLSNTISSKLHRSLWMVIKSFDQISSSNSEEYWDNKEI